LSDKVGVFVLDPHGDDPQTIRNRRKLPTSAAEDYALARLQTLGGKDKEGYIEPHELLKFGKFVDKFHDRVETHVARQKWFKEAPSKSIERWSYRGGVALVAGFVLGVLGFVLPSSGILLMGVAVGAASVVVLVLARVMPARTMPGAMLYAMLAAYKRTLHKTMEQARSMDQVVAEARLPWLETPDQAAVWSVALGLQGDVPESARAQCRGRQPRARDLGRGLGSDLVQRRQRFDPQRVGWLRRLGARADVCLGGAGLRRHDVGHRHHR